ncbi:DEAD/DEAH box helicase [Anaeroselena agilis]|uniref:DEAD/DEAH box helicase n=1 Tax=Anaeroselena agilis TaxID=3063788 RepID=A0ABU3P013_9FIRM|nr:DEAD/DEAH box helicase [Selenomonadales bacterium 4137-cl]MDT8901863.1 DEAD/DEAH box helicase [Selenomonadales bacterium 4137-cl]
MTVPQYLQFPSEAEYYYGTLTFNERKQDWEIEGEPCVIEIAQRLFPGSKTYDRTRVRFRTNRRTNGDLNWLMLRYPLRIADEAKWRQTYEETVQHVLKREAINKAPTKVTPPPAFTGTLREYQKESLAHLMHNRRTLDADEMGLGKTPIALAFLSAVNAWPALIVVPPHLILGWLDKIAQFLDLPPSIGQAPTLFSKGKAVPPFVHVIKGLKPYDLPTADIYIMHYLILRGWKNELPEYGFKTVIFDEIQELRHRQTEKYSAASLVADKAENVIGLSGTPIYGRGGQIWNVMNIIDFHCLSDWESFSRTWCYGYDGDIVTDPANLGDYLKREGLMIRHTKADVLGELPPKRRVVEPIESDQAVFSNLIREAVEKAQGYDAIKDMLEKGRVKREIEGAARMATGIAKASAVCAFVRMLLEAGEKVLLFAYHHAVFDIYMEELREFRPGKITGQEDAAAKNEAVEMFKSGMTPLCCISLRTAAGLDGLQVATSVVFGELDWSPAIHSQCEDRAHRIGQENSILCYYLVSEDGSDETIQEALGLKTEQFLGLMGDKAETEEDRAIAQTVATQHMSNLVEKIKAIKLNKVKSPA